MYLAWEESHDGPEDEHINEEDWTKGIYALNPVRGHPDLIIAWVDGVRIKFTDGQIDQKVYVVNSNEYLM